MKLFVQYLGRKLEERTGLLTVPDCCAASKATVNGSLLSKPSLPDCNVITLYFSRFAKAIAERPYGCSSCGGYRRYRLLLKVRYIRQLCVLCSSKDKSVAVNSSYAIPLSKVLQANTRTIALTELVSVRLSTGETTFLPT